jgi:hypothetical protein
MMQTMTRRTQESLCSFHISAAVLIAAAMLTYSNARADTSVVDITYSPSQSSMASSLGMGVYALKDGGPGFYINGSISGGPDNAYSSSCYYSCGSITSTQQSADLFAVGATFPLVTSDMQVPIYRTLHTYLGLGYGSLSGYAKYSSSDYWYTYSSKDESGVNVNGGFIFGFDGFALNVGVNSLSKTVYFGIGINTDKK